MNFGTRAQQQKCMHVKVTIGNQELENVDQYKYLGVVFDSGLTFSKHVDHIRNKTLGKIRTLGTVRNFMDQSTAVMLFKTLVVPLFEYCDFVYDALTEKDKYTLQKLQNCCLRNILQTGRLTPTIEMHNRLSLLPLSDKRFVNTCSEMHKIYHNSAPNCISTKFTRIGDVHLYNTRGAARNDFYIQPTRTKLAKGNFSVRGAHAWHSVPECLKEIENRKGFKNALQAHLVAKQARDG